MSSRLTCTTGMALCIMLVMSNTILSCPPWECPGCQSGTYPWCYDEDIKCGGGSTPYCYNAECVECEQTNHCTGCKRCYNNACVNSDFTMAVDPNIICVNGSVSAGSSIEGCNCAVGMSMSFPGAASYSGGCFYTCFCSYTATYDSAGEYTITTTCGNRQLSRSVTVVGVDHIDTNKVAECYLNHDGIVFTAYSDPENKPMNCLEWAYKFKATVSSSWSNWTVCSGNGATFKLGDDSFPSGYYIVGARNGEKDGNGNPKYIEYEQVKLLPHPTNFHQTNVTSINGELQFVYEWESPTEDLGDLSACFVREYVTYPSSSDPYYWPSPPWQYGKASSNPTASFPEFPGTTRSIKDTHHKASYSSPPYIEASFSATQIYQFRCTRCNNGEYQTLYNVGPITRSVSDKGSYWEYKIQKSGSEATETLP